MDMTLKDGDQLEHQAFRSLIPKDIYDLLTQISREGFSLTLVGGAVRDYLRTGELPTDFDFELRHTFDYDEADWTFRVNRLGERLREIYRYQVEFLSFSILRVSWNQVNYDVELGPARIEKYEQGESFGHSDFKETLVSNAPYEQTFARRDFTINAMGIEFRTPMTENEFIFVDPYNGIEDLKSRSLRPCGENFAKDPVRFCRAIRFAKKYDFEYSKELEEAFRTFNLTHLSLFYFLRESFKGDFFAFVDEFFALSGRHGLHLPEQIEKLSFIKGRGREGLKLSSPEEALQFFIFGDSDSSLEEESIRYFCKSAKISISLMDSFKSLYGHLTALRYFSAKDFKAEFKKMNFHEFLELEGLDALKAIQKFNSRFGKEKVSFLVRVNSSLYSLYLEVYDLFPAALMGKELFEEYLEKEAVKNEERGLLLLFCHLKVVEKRWS